MINSWRTPSPQDARNLASLYAVESNSVLTFPDAGYAVHTNLDYADGQGENKL